MLAALRENWKYKLLALVCALALHAYVIGQSTEGQQRTISTTVEARDIPADLLADGKPLPQISVVLDGPSDDLAHIADTSVTASVELSHAHAGQNGALPVHITLPPGIEGTVSTDPQPSFVSLMLLAKSRRHLLISATDPGMPPPGYIFRSPVVTPRRALIEGSRSAVDAVQRLSLKLDDDTAGTVDDNFPVVALDSTNAPVEGLSITPSSAHVHIEMVRVPASRTLLISPVISGLPAFPARVSNIQVNPSTLTVTGKPDKLAHAGVINTPLIDISGATSDLTRQVACAAPPGLSIVGSSTVTVTVRIATPSEPLLAPSPPAEPETSPAPPALILRR